MNWKSQIYERAYAIAEQFSTKPGVLAVGIGGSIARDEVWKHSDVELIVVVEETIPSFTYFNQILDIGVEVIQFKRSDMVRFLDEYAQTGDPRGVLHFKIQAYRCRVRHDPSGLLTRFKALFDALLFCDEIRALKRTQHADNADRLTDQARQLVASGQPNSALAGARLAINEWLQASYWHHGILLRSQNRTVYLLKRNRSVLGSDLLYDSYLTIYDLQRPAAERRAAFFAAKAEVFEIVSGSWGPSIVPFLEESVDGQLAWGQDRSIQFVYQWCVLVIHASKLAEAPFDDPAFALKYPQLVPFLGFDRIGQAQLTHYLDLIEQVKTEWQIKVSTTA